MGKSTKVERESAKIGRKLSGIVSQNISGWLLIIPSVFLFTFIIWRPIIIGITYSFFELEGFTPIKFAGIKNFVDVITDTNFLKTLWNTVQYVFWSLIIGFPLPFICATMLNELIHFQGFFKVSTYLPVIIPGIATCLIWKMAYMEGPGGLLNMVRYVFGAEPTMWLSNKNIVIPLIIISMTWNTFGRTLIMYLSTLQGVNQELYEAARLDGAGVFGRIRHVLFPHMRGVLLLLAINQIIAVFNVTEQPLVMTGGGPNGASMSLGLTNYFYAFKYGQYDRSLALGVVTFALLSVLTIIYFAVDKRVSE